MLFIKTKQFRLDKNVILKTKQFIQHPICGWLINENVCSRTLLKYDGVRSGCLWTVKSKTFEVRTVLYGDLNQNGVRRVLCLRDTDSGTGFVPRNRSVVFPSHQHYLSQIVTKQHKNLSPFLPGSCILSSPAALTTGPKTSKPRTFIEKKIKSLNFFQKKF